MRYLLLGLQISACAFKKPEPKPDMQPPGQVEAYKVRAAGFYIFLQCVSGLEITGERTQRVVTPYANVPIAVLIVEYSITRGFVL